MCNPSGIKGWNNTWEMLKKNPQENKAVFLSGFLIQQVWQ